MTRRALLLLVVLAACSKASDENEAKRSPAPPPPPRVAIPTDLSIAVTVDGVAAPPITRDRLDQLAPDFQDTERRAWRLTTLVPALDVAGAAVDARGPEGVSIRMSRPDDAKLPQPVLYFTRRGDVVVSVIDPTDPFPNYHGQGGQLRRQGDPLPRLSPVSALAIETHPAK
jgi:hypothetical protein